MGDTWEPAATTARAAGIGTVRAGLLPQDKAAPITQLRRERGPVAMVGDGIGAVADAVMLARATRTIIRQNLGSAFGYNLIPVPLAAAACPAVRARRRHGRQLWSPWSATRQAAPLRQDRGRAGGRPPAA